MIQLNQALSIVRFGFEFRHPVTRFVRIISQWLFNEDALAVTSKPMLRNFDVMLVGSRNKNGVNILV